MKTMILLLSLFSFGPCVDVCAQYRHKSEAEIAAMTSAQSVDEYADEHAYHKYDYLDPTT